MSNMTGNQEAVSVLGSLLQSTEEPCPRILLGAGASFRSGVQTASDAVKQIARLVDSERELKTIRLVKTSEWESWLHSFDWFLPEIDPLAENFPPVVQHVPVSTEFRKRVLLDLMRPVNGVSNGYKIVADFVKRRLGRTEEAQRLRDVLAAAGKTEVRKNRYQLVRLSPAATTP